MRFSWDSNKAETNLSKHDVSFEEAATVFADQFHLSFLDELHSDAEERWVTIGFSNKGNILVVIHTHRDYKGREIIRIISARKAAERECRTYNERRR